MRSKRSRQWHVRKEIAKVRRIIEQGLVQPVPDDAFVAFAHPSVAHAIKQLMAKGEFGRVEGIRFVRGKP